MHDWEPEEHKAALHFSLDWVERLRPILLNFTRFELCRLSCVLTVSVVVVRPGPALALCVSRLALAGCPGYHRLMVTSSSPQSSHSSCPHTLRQSPHTTPLTRPQRSLSHLSWGLSAVKTSLSTITHTGTWQLERWDRYIIFYSVFTVTALFEERWSQKIIAREEHLDQKF